jgi:hypothetical protein
MGYGIYNWHYMDIRLINRMNNRKCDKHKQNGGFATNIMDSW